MKNFITCLAIVCAPLFATSQKITGLWLGTLQNDTTQTSLPYQILITEENGKLTGYSHTSFVADGKLVYGIKKVKISTAKDGKIIIRDEKLLENNYPEVDKNVYQLNVLTLKVNGSEPELDGPFVTNRTKTYSQLTGHINLKHAAEGVESALTKFVEQYNNANQAVATK
jgi:hypothetical protein